MKRLHSIRSIIVFSRKIHRRYSDENYIRRLLLPVFLLNSYQCVKNASVLLQRHHSLLQPSCKRSRLPARLRHAMSQMFSTHMIPGNFSAITRNIFSERRTHLLVVKQLHTYICLNLPKPACTKATCMSHVVAVLSESGVFFLDIVY